MVDEPYVDGDSADRHTTPSDSGSEVGYSEETSVDGASVTPPLKPERGSSLRIKEPHEWDDLGDFVLEPLAYLSFLTSMVASWSSIPVFMIICVLALQVLYARMAMWLMNFLDNKPPLPESVVLFLRILAMGLMVSTLLTLAWDSLKDSVTERPVLSPHQLKSFRKAVEACPGSTTTDGRFMLLVFHFSSAVMVMATCVVAQNNGLLSLPFSWTGWLFPANFMLKLLLFLLALRFSHGGGGEAPPERAGLGPALRQAFALYSAFSDLLLFAVVSFRDLSGCGRDDWFPSEIDEEKRRQILAFNLVLVVLSNMWSCSYFMYRLARRWDQPIRSSQWHSAIEHSRMISLGVVVGGWAIAAVRTGLLPSFFSLSVLFTGTSINRLSLLFIIESVRTLAKLKNLVKGAVEWLGGYAEHWSDHPDTTKHRYSPADRAVVGASALVGLVSVLLALVQLAYGAEAVHTLVTRGLAVAVCLAYRQLSERSMGPGIFRHRKIDSMVFLPILTVLGWSVYRAALLELGPSKPLFQVHTGPHGINVTSMVGTIEMIYAQEDRSSAPHPRPLTLDEGTMNPAAYPFCGVSYKGSSLLDYALMSLLSYLDPQSRSFQALFEHFVGQDDWEVAHVPNHTRHGANFIEFYSPRRNTSIVAVRGTNPLHFLDLLQDTLLFHRAFAFDLAAQLVPTLRWMPPIWASYILSLGNMPLHLFGRFDQRAYYHHELIDHVEHKAAQRAVILTGHSLGGAIAKIVSAGTGAPVVAISSPGVFLSSRGFNVSADSLPYLETNLVADNDIVPLIDRLQGTLYRVGCTKTNPLHCHQPGQTICELVMRCGHTLGGRTLKSCRHIT